jgi:hypothetical protein
MHGMISYITSEIPDTDDVKDVTTYQKISTFLGEVANSIWQNIDFDSEASVKEARERLSSYNFGDGFYGFTQRQFTTMMELEAYKQGLNDACGWMEYNYITNEMVDKLNVKSDDK